MKKIQYSIVCSLLLGLLVACDKDKLDFNRDNVNPSGVGYYPVSTNGLVDLPSKKTLATSAGSATVFAAGYEVKAELQYFSESPVKEINLFNTVGAGTRTKVGTWPYAKAYSTAKKLDTLLVPYSIPAVASNTVVKLEYEILNQNALNVIRTVYVKVQ